MNNTIQVSVIVPCRNEIKYIHSFLESIINQRLNGLRIEVIIADGMSNDGTREIIQEFCKLYPYIRMIDNSQKIVSTGLNQAIKQANGEIIIRMDTHTEYSSDYIYQCVSVLKETQADNVGGPWRAVGKNYLQNAIAIAFHSPFSCGGAGSHFVNKEGTVDSVYLGCWKKSTLLKLGLFDEEFVRNQDDELNLRIIRSGGKIWQSPKIQSFYYPRSSIKALFRQYTQYGYWKVRVIKKHKLPASIRHLIPAIFLVNLILFALLSIFFDWAWFIFLAIISAYMLTNLLATLIVCNKSGSFKYIPVIPFVFSTFHFGYGYGFLRGLIDFILKKSKNDTFAKLTR